MLEYPAEKQVEYFSFACHGMHPEIRQK